MPTHGTNQAFSGMFGGLGKAEAGRNAHSRQAGQHVYLADRPQRHWKPHSAASVQSFIYFRGDALATPRRAMLSLILPVSALSRSGRTSRRAMPDHRTAEERAQIEHELEMLRTRHALMARWGGVARIFVAIVIPCVRYRSRIRICRRHRGRTLHHRRQRGCRGRPLGRLRPHSQSRRSTAPGYPHREFYPFGLSFSLACVSSKAEKRC